MKRVAVLKGGWSSEREVSLTTGVGVEKALAELGYSVYSIDVSRDLDKLMAAIHAAKPDIIFNALHGLGGEDGIIQGVLEYIGIPYTHSNVLASALGMDKVLSRKLFALAGIPVPEYMVVSLEALRNHNPMNFPYVTKPNADGSTVGISIIRSDADRMQAVNNWAFGEEVLIERYIPGRDLFVPLINGKAIGVIEVKANSGFYDYEAKYADNMAAHIINPTDIPPHWHEKALTYSQQAHHALKCRGVTRTDFRYDESTPGGALYMLEINTQPGLTPLSLVPEVAAHVGMPYTQLIQTMLESATCDNPRKN
jgi:D-alanine-D-alanine ligase